MIRKWPALLSIVIIASFVLSACAQATPTAAPAAPAATQPPAAPAATQPPAAPAASQPPAAPASKYKEAPMLTELVKAG